MAGSNGGIYADACSSICWFQPEGKVEFAVCFKDRWVYGKKEDSCTISSFVIIVHPFHMKSMNHTSIFLRNNSQFAAPDFKRGKWLK